MMVDLCSLCLRYCVCWSQTVPKPADRSAKPRSQASQAKPANRSAEPKSQTIPKPVNCSAKPPQNQLITPEDSVSNRPQNQPSTPPKRVVPNCPKPANSFRQAGSETAQTRHYLYQASSPNPTQNQITDRSVPKSSGFASRVPNRPKPCGSAKQRVP